MDPEIDFEAELADLDIAAELSALEQPQPKAGMATPGVGMALTAAKAAPAIMSIVNKGAGVVGQAAKSASVPGIVAGAVGSLASGGDPKTTALSAIGGVAVPKVASMIQKATAPAKALNTGSQFVKATSKAGPLMRGAGWLSKIAGAAALPATMLSTYSDLASELYSRIANDENLDPEVRRALLTERGGF
jgi:hypothetical protein